jgi:hypothetical protein
MKKICLLFLTGAALFLTGCASSKIEPASLDKMAVITIGGNSHLPWYEKVNGKETSAVQGVLSKAIDNIKNSDDPEIRESFNRLDYAEESLIRTFEEILGIGFVDKEEVVKNKNYRTMSEGLLSVMNTTITANGYKDVRSPDKYHMRKMSSELGANSFIVLNFEFFKKITKGSVLGGTGAPFIKMKVKLYNSEGKEIKYKTYYAEGAESIPVAGKRYDKEKLVSLYSDVIDQLMAKAALDLINE